MNEGDAHAPHGALPCLHTPLLRFHGHVIVTSGVLALWPTILDNGGVVFAGMCRWARQLV